MMKITRKKASTKHRYRCRIAGFTLIEVMIVLVIVGILSAIGFPTITKWVPSYRLKAATQELYADFQKAKMHAVKTNNDVIFQFTFLAACSGPTGYTFTDDTGVVVVSETMNDGVCIYDSNFDNTSGFDPRGLAAGQLGTVKLKHAATSRVYQISQSIAGRVRIE